METKVIRVTEQVWKDISHLSIELKLTRGETIREMYNHYKELSVNKKNPLNKGK